MRGLILEGGGSKGSYQIGAYKALKEIGIDFDGIAGTSVGALNGALIVQDEYEKAHEIWTNITPQKVINIENEIFEKIKDIDINIKNFNMIIKILSNTLNNKGLDISPLKDMLKQHIDENKIRNSKKDFGIVTVSINSLKPQRLFLDDIPQNMLVDYLIASSSLPIFKLEKINGKLYLDGGFYDNLPISLLKDKGYDELIVIRLYGIGRTKRVDTKGMKILYINPSEHLGPTLDFNKNRSEKNIQLGYHDALKSLNKLYGNRYYFKIDETCDEFYFDLIKNMNNKTIGKIADKLKIKGEISLRLLLEKVVPKLGELLDLGKTFSYKDLLISIYEIRMNQLEFERLKVYNFKEIFWRINRNYNFEEYECKDILNRILIKKENLINNITKEIIMDIQDRVK
ncbi:patatin-like phospholipase family protein [Tepidibacter hydrothermalis]|uniref:Patatin-like phospholipase family protein n=1 Tax=Tepidibacter hydrothermalis TaxID=3036126 RepID=A0ABY8E8J3_9FIRM|nr:patatin-like phospholipase family protein [Tepidibacter hydrothermalis]WFD09213.1 patatin-like phospholipase family protein [Tepidibacter hydrothermalis]